MATHSRPSVRVITLGFGRSSADLALVVSTLAAAALAVLLHGPSIARVPLSLLAVFVLPGYALSVALFPLGQSSLSERGRAHENGLTLLDRAVLAVGLSLAVAVVVGLAVAVGPPAVAAPSLLGGIGAVTLVTVPVAFYRRNRAPVAERFAPFAPRGAREARADGGVAQIDLLGVVLAVSVLFAGGAVAYSTGVGGADAGVTEFYFLTESADGGLQAGDYPTNFTRDETRSLTLAVGNREGARTNYSVVGQIQRVERRNGTAVVNERRRVFDGAVAVPAGETRTLDASVTPRTTGEYRLTYLLYRGDAPARPTVDSAYREIHLWIDVTEPGNETAS